jgi:hypothetical protein
MIFRFSLKQLLIVVALSSVACAALARPGYWWHATIATAVVVGTLGLLIAALVCESPRRAFAVGWLVLTVGYLAVVLGPWTSTQLAPQLLSTKGIAKLEAKWHGNQPSPPLFGQILHDVNGDRNPEIWLSDSGNFNSRALWVYNTGQLVYQQAAPPTSWWATANYTVFQATAHWLIAAVLGYWGGVFGVFVARKISATPKLAE